MAVTMLTAPADTHPNQPYPRWHHRKLPGGGLVSDTTGGDSIEIHLCGEIDVYDRHALCDVFTAVALQAQGPVVHVIADAVNFIDLRTLQLIAQVRTQLARNSRSLVLTGLRGVYAAAWAELA